MLTILKCEDLAELDDGRVGIAVNQFIKQICQDMHARPGESAVRKLKIELGFRPFESQDGMLDGSDMTIDVSTNLPKKKMRATALVTNANGVFMHNTVSPDDAKQATIDEL